MSKLVPEARWRVSCENGRLIDVDPNNVRCETDIDRIRRIRIATNDTGPRGADVWWVFEGIEGAVLSAFPQGATGEQAVVDWAMSLPGFDYEAMSAAMRCVDNADFVVWPKD